MWISVVAFREAESQLCSVQVCVQMALCAERATTEEARRQGSRRVGEMKCLRDASAACWSGKIHACLQ